MQVPTQLPNEGFEYRVNATYSSCVLSSLPPQKKGGQPPICQNYPNFILHFTSGTSSSMPAEICVASVLHLILGVDSIDELCSLTV